MLAARDTPHILLTIIISFSLSCSEPSARAETLAGFQTTCPDRHRWHPRAKRRCLARDMECLHFVGQLANPVSCCWGQQNAWRGTRTVDTWHVKRQSKAVLVKTGSCQHGRAHHHSPDTPAALIPARTAQSANSARTRLCSLFVQYLVHETANERQLVSEGTAKKWGGLI